MKVEEEPKPEENKEGEETANLDNGEEKPAD